MKQSDKINSLGNTSFFLFLHMCVMLCGIPCSLMLMSISQIKCAKLCWVKYNAYNAINECGIDTLSDRGQVHCCKFAPSLSTCTQTDNLIPLWENQYTVRICVTLSPSRPIKKETSPIPNNTDALQSCLEELQLLVRYMCLNHT